MAHGKPIIDEILASMPEGEFERRYLAFFECFNRRLFFEAHEVLEALWLPRRGTSRDRFYKGLIQLAGAFVHLENQRPEPAAALLRLAQSNLRLFAPVCDGLDVTVVLELVEEWLARLKGGLSGTIETPKLEAPRTLDSFVTRAGR